MFEAKRIQKQIRICIIIVSVFFALSILQGFLLAVKDTEMVKEIVSRTFASFSNIRNMEIGRIFLFILLNNVIKGFFVIIAGILFGIPSILFIFLNGELIGFVLGLSRESGIGLPRIIVGIIPHGLLEIPAIILSASYGLWLGYRFYRFLWLHDELKIYFSYALEKYLKLILPLFLAAALIETFVTPYVISLLK